MTINTNHVSGNVHHLMVMQHKWLLLFVLFVHWPKIRSPVSKCYLQIVFCVRTHFACILPKRFVANWNDK